MRVYLTWFARRPAARAVVLFSALNLFMVLFFTLLVPPLLRGTTANTDSPLVIPEDLLVRVAIAAFTFGVIVWSVRPGQRSGAELAFLALVGVVFVGITTVYYLPILALVVISVVAHFWLSLRRTTLLSIGTIAVTSPIWAGMHTQGSLLIPAAITGLISVIATVYIMLSFEMVIKEARAREELDASHRQLLHYRDLEIQHAHLEERTRISRELHDTLGHHLTAQRFDLQVMLKLAPPENAPLRAALQRALERNREAIGDVRRAVQALQPGELQTGLREALEELLALWPDRHTVDFRVSGQEYEVSGDVKLAVYRAAQEALTNARKHAPGQEIHLRLRFEDDAVVFEARNRMPTERVPAGEIDTGGQGLRGLSERARALGGKFRMQRLEGEFSLWMSLPAFAY
ncbi:signal transduction histidine kinase [Deinobacterium chartae]|uniref:Signal transduction histidine kinase n=1 Tax=Deinobacterium chartae TaxID=521158 RepID=A0A841HXE2_9DEIO|nr:histidine kinase [Deinobacterium chartae]MBB6097576.1 signal transduction histidine kinase [Deinobacterium chartae]